MNMIKNFFFNIAKKQLLKRVNTDSFKNMLVKQINKRIDIPNMNEKQEAKLFRAVIDSLCIFLKIPNLKP